MQKSLPTSPNLEQLKKQARELLLAFQAQEPAALARALAWLRAPANATSAASTPALRLSDA